MFGRGVCYAVPHGAAFATLQALNGTPFTPYSHAQAIGCYVLVLLQGPFDANTMSRWCGENALPKDLKCLGVHPQDSNLVPSSQTLNHFQPLEKLLDNTRAGIQYMPVRLGKGSFSDEGPATPSAQQPKGSRTPAGPGVPGMAQGAPAGAPLNGGPDVTRAVDQRSALAAAAAAAAASGSMNGFTAQQQAALQGHPLMAHLQQMQLRPGSQPRPQQQLSQQQGPPGRRPGQQPGGPPNQFLHEQHAGIQQQGGFVPPGAAAQGVPGQEAGEQAGELTPNDEAWEPAFLKLIKRDGFVGKEADVKWRVILQSGMFWLSSSSSACGCWAECQLLQSSNNKCG